MVERGLQGDANYGFQYVRIDGNVPVKKRGVILSRFREDPNVRVILVTLSCGACGYVNSLSLSRVTCPTGERRTRASAAPHQLCAPLSSQRTMAQRSATLPASNEADIQLAISSIDSYQNLSNRSAAAIYRVSERTIRRRRAGKPARRDCQPNSKKLT
jgi:hypothetical protein